MVYPSLTHLIKEIGMDNNMSLLAPEERGWGLLNTKSLERLERKADEMTAGEREIYATGEDRRVDFLVRKYDASELHTFLNDVFDGPYTSFFFEEPKLA